MLEGLLRAAQLRPHLRVKETWRVLQAAFKNDVFVKRWPLSLGRRPAELVRRHRELCGLVEQFELADWQEVILAQSQYRHERCLARR